MSDMGRQIIFITTLLLTSCGESPRTDDSKIVEAVMDTSTQSSSPTHLKTDSSNSKIDIPLAFINGYVDNCNRMNQRIDDVVWVSSNNLTTKSFRAELKRILDDAYTKDPKVGLGFDPILDAQDWPDKGFELESIDERTNFLTVRGIDWPEFKLTMKIIEENGTWLVDGSGIINIPKEERAER
jgi:hypothetical protein